MYNQRNNRFRGGNHFAQRRGGSSRGRQIQKNFNPTLLVNNLGPSNISPINQVPEAPTTNNTFDEFLINPEIKKNISLKGYINPTPIQNEAIPHILKGLDVIGIANTGTGKTGAFLIPLIDKILKNRTEKVLIVVPTRELAVQIRDECVAFSKGLGIYCVLCIGGANINRQKDDLRHIFNFVIGTPGRIKELVKGRNIPASLFHTIVLDETDLMVDIGFIHDIKEIISFFPRDRQSLFFSATVDGKVKEIIDNFVRNPITISVKKHEITQNVHQEIISVKNSENKIQQLHDLLIQKEYEKVLIFGRTKWGVQKLSNELIRRGFKADAIHGNKKQNQRQRTLEKFKRSEIQILLATDVASRGLDIPNVTHVINYELPESQDAYIHRIGRTGRLDKRGIALTFVG